MAPDSTDELHSVFETRGSASEDPEPDERAFAGLTLGGRWEIPESGEKFTLEELNSENSEGAEFIMLRGDVHHFELRDFMARVSAGLVEPLDNTACRAEEFRRCMER